MRYRVSAVVMAAGLSRRMGSNKLLLPLDAKPMLEHTLCLIESLGLHQAILVTTPDISQKIQIPPCFELVHNHHPQRGQSQSMRLGVEAATGDYFMFFTGDQPLLDRDTVGLLLDAMDGQSIVIPQMGDAPTTPTLFPSRFRRQLGAMTGDRGGRQVRQQHAQHCKYVKVPQPLRLQDVDTHAAYEQVADYFEKKERNAMKLLGNGILITLDENNTVYQDGCVAFDGNLIKEVGQTSALRGKYPDAEFIDARGRVIMPGLINVHSHIYSAMARGMFLPNAPVSRNFQEILENLWWRIDSQLDEESMKYSALHTYMESIRYGVTTVFDHHASFGKGQVLGSLDILADAAIDVGIRTSLCYEVSDRGGRQLADESVEENIRCIKRVRQMNNPLVDALFGLHASFTIGNETMEKCGQAGKDLGCGFHVHVAEGPGDLDACLKEHGKRIVHRLNDYGMLGEKTLAVHCIHIDEEEMDLLLSTNTAVVHNPESNMGNAVGCSDVPKMMKKGILVGLGTDAYTQDMFESLKVANIIHKHVYGDPSAIMGEAQQMLLQNNRLITQRHFANAPGRIESGAPADMIVVDYIPNTPIDHINYTGHITFGMNGGMVDTTIVAGDIVMKDRQFTKLDAEKIYAESRASSQKLWDRIVYEPVGAK